MQAIDDLVFETYTKRTGEPSWVFEEFAAKVASIVADRCQEIAGTSDSGVWAARRIKREFAGYKRGL